MKFSWGTGILIFLIVFLAACGIFIAFAMSQRLNLVHKDYYKKGADHTEQMVIDKRSVKYTDSIYIKDKDKFLTVNFPDNFSDNLKTGNILFFRPSDDTEDIEFELALVNNKQLIDKNKLVKGRYIVKITWQKDHSFYIEKEYIVK